MDSVATHTEDTDTRRYEPGNDPPARSERILGSKLRRALGIAGTKWRLATNEAEQLFGMGSTWPDRLRLSQFLAKLYLVRALPWRSYTWDASIQLYGSNFTVGLRSSEIYILEEVFEHRLYDRIAGYIPSDGWVVLDVGANVGIVSMLAAQRGAQVYSIEPNPECYRRLLKNINNNNLHDRIDPFNMALSNTTGSGFMQVSNGGTTGGTLVKGASSTTGELSNVAVTTLDSIVAMRGISRIDLLKIDVEGAENDVLRGGTQALSITRRLIIEFHSRELLQQVQETLTRSGFVLEHNVEYYPEDLAAGQAEVGILYAARPGLGISPPPH